MDDYDRLGTPKTPRGAQRWWLAIAVAVCLILGTGIAVVAAEAAETRRAQADAEAARAEAAEAWAKEVEAARARQARKTAREEAAAERAAREEAAAEKAAAEKAAREKAAAEKAAREKAAAEKAAREKAAAEKAAARQHDIHGEIAVSDINGALVTQVGGHPGQPLSELTGRQLDRLGALLRSVEEGRTYPCPGGAGGRYSDLTVGAQVVATDGEGAVLATATLEGGRVTANGCTFDYRLTVPDAPFYQVTVANRGALVFSREQLARADWQVSGKV